MRFLLGGVLKILLLGTLGFLSAILAVLIPTVSTERSGVLLLWLGFILIQALESLVKEKERRARIKTLRRRVHR
jgi:prepilin signal peptidase PulO-like enzyme (type II secretory pathway)